MSRERMRPNWRIPEYSGPYRRDMLENARSTLLGIIDSKDTVIWSRIRKKTGMFGSGGRNASFSGYGQASCEFSHADLEENREQENDQDFENFANNNSQTNCTRNNSQTNYTSTSSTTNYQPPTQQMVGTSGVNNNSVSTSSVINEDNSTQWTALHSPERATPPEVILLDNDLEGYEKAKMSNVIVLDNDPDIKRANSQGVIVLDSDEEEASPVKKTRYDKSADFIPLDSGLTGYYSVPQPSKEFLGKRDILDRRWESYESNERAYKREDGEIREEKEGESEDGEIWEEIEDESEDDGIKDVEEDGEIREEKEDGRRGVMMRGKTLDSTDRSRSGHEISITCSLETSGKPGTFEKEQDVYDSAFDTEKRIVFKCDFCDVITDTTDEMRQHLKHKVHYSASSFLSNSDKDIVQLKERLVLINKRALFKTVLAVCPDPTCSDVFRTIHECSLHYTLKHDCNAPSIYGLVNVVKDIPCNIQIKNLTCSGCGLGFKKERQFAKHMKLSGHVPFKQEEGLTNYFLCLACLQIHTYFGSAYRHKTKSHKGKIEDGILRLRVLFGSTKEIHSLPKGPQQSVGTEKMKKIRDEAEMKIRWPDENIETVDDPTSAGLQESYKCDYCDIISDDSESVLKHLRSEKHQSASLILLNSSGTPVYLKKPLALTSHKEKESIMAICPVEKCNQTFRDIYVCSEHFSTAHDEAADPTYALAPVEFQTTIIFKFEEDSFKPQSPIPDCMVSKSQSAYKCFRCSCNPQPVFCNHTILMGHLNRCHGSNGHRCAQKQVCVTFFLVSTSRIRYSMLPFKNDRLGELACIERKIESLLCLRKSVKKKRKFLRVKTNNLKKLQRQLKSRIGQTLHVEPCAVEVTVGSENTS